MRILSLSLFLEILELRSCEFDLEMSWKLGVMGSFGVLGFRIGIRVFSDFREVRRSWRVDTDSESSDSIS